MELFFHSFPGDSFHQSCDSAYIDDVHAFAAPQKGSGPVMAMEAPKRDCPCQASLIGAEYLFCLLVVGENSYYYWVLLISKTKELLDQIAIASICPGHKFCLIVQ